MIDLDAMFSMVRIIAIATIPISLTFGIAGVILNKFELLIGGISTAVVSGIWLGGKPMFDAIVPLQTIASTTVAKTAEIITGFFTEGWF